MQEVDDLQIAPSTIFSQTQLQDQVSIALMKKVMDTQNASSQQMVKMINEAAPVQAAHPHLGSKLDIQI